MSKRDWLRAKTKRSDIAGNTPAPDRAEVRYWLGAIPRVQTGPHAGLTIGEVYAKDPHLVRYLATKWHTKLGNAARQHLRYVDETSAA